MYREDSTVFEHAGKDCIAVGWLAADRPFPQGDCDPEILRALVRQAVENPQEQTRGFHPCPFCPSTPNDDWLFGVPFEYQDEVHYLGSAEIHVPTLENNEGASIFVCPDLIVHYIDTHRYRPPLDCLDAVRRIAQNPDETEGFAVSRRHTPMGSSEVRKLFSYSDEECETFPHIRRYMTKVQDIPLDLSKKTTRNRFMLAGLFLTYQTCNHKEINMSTNGYGLAVDSIHARRLRAFGQESGLRIRSTLDYLDLIKFKSWKLLWGGVSGFLIRLVLSGQRQSE